MTHEWNIFNMSMSKKEHVYNSFLEWHLGFVFHCNLLWVANWKLNQHNIHHMASIVYRWCWMILCGSEGFDFGKLPSWPHGTVQPCTRLIAFECICMYKYPIFHLRNIRHDVYLPCTSSHPSWHQAASAKSLGTLGCRVPHRSSLGYMRRQMIPHAFWPSHE